MLDDYVCDKLDCMDRKTVVFDLDDVIVDTAPHILSNHNRLFGTDLTLDDYYKDNFETAWGMPKDQAVLHVNAYLNSDHCHDLTPSDEALEVIARLESKYDLAIVTGRPDQVSESTSHWLNRHFPGVFNNVIFSNFFANPEKARHKGDICKELGAISLVDDHISHIQSAADFGINTYLFGEFPWSGNDVLPKGTQRASDWNHLESLILDEK